MVISQRTAHLGDSSFLNRFCLLLGAPGHTTRSDRMLLGARSRWFLVTMPLLLVASLLLVVRPGAPRSFFAIFNSCFRCRSLPAGEIGPSSRTSGGSFVLALVLPVSQKAPHIICISHPAQALRVPHTFKHTFSTRPRTEHCQTSKPLQFGSPKPQPHVFSSSQ